MARLQAALASLGDDDGAERAALEAALKKAREQSTMPSIDSRIASNQAFIDRARKRISGEEEKIKAAQEQLRAAQERKAKFEEELAEGEKAKADLEKEAASPALNPSSGSATPEVLRLQAKFQATEAELHAPQCHSEKTSDGDGASITRGFCSCHIGRGGTLDAFETTRNWRKPFHRRTKQKCPGWHMRFRRVQFSCDSGPNLRLQFRLWSFDGFVCGRRKLRIEGCSSRRGVSPWSQTGVSVPQSQPSQQGATPNENSSDEEPLIPSATQWSAGASFSLPSMGPEFCSGTEVASCDSLKMMRMTPVQSSVLSATDEDREDTLLDVLEQDLRGDLPSPLRVSRKVAPTDAEQESIPETSSVIVCPSQCEAQDGWSHPSVASVAVHNRFAVLTEEEVHDIEGSDTESCGEPNQSSRRLRLVWRPHHEPEPDSHEERFQRVRQAMLGERRVEAQTRAVHAATEFLRRLVERVGSFRIEDGVPREIRRQQWSVFNVPLMWAASEGDEECALLEWVSSIADRLPPM